MPAPTFRRAVAGDLPALVKLLADDPLGASREEASSPLHQTYLAAFEEIDSDPNQLLVVVAEGEGVIGTLQLSFIPGLARKGSWRGQIEAVRIAASHRGQGLGEELFRWAIEQCRNRGCRLVQLTTDKDRLDAHRFYEKLGFVASHVGYKLTL